MAFIEVKLDDGTKTTINTGFIYKIYKDKKKLGHSIIVYDYEMEVQEFVDEPYESLVERIQGAEDGLEVNKEPGE